MPVAEGHTMTLDAVVMPPRNNPSRVRLSLGTQYTCGNACAGGGSVTGSPTLRENKGTERREKNRDRERSVQWTVLHVGTYTLGVYFLPSLPCCTNVDGGCWDTMTMGTHVWRSWERMLCTKRCTPWCNITSSHKTTSTWLRNPDCTASSNSCQMYCSSSPPSGVE